VFSLSLGMDKCLLFFIVMANTTLPLLLKTRK
jgi:hypothetical protein